MQGSNSKKVVRGFSLFQNVQNGSDTHPISYSKVTEVLQAVKRSKCDTGHSPPSSVEINNNEHNYISAPNNKPSLRGQGHLYLYHSRPQPLTQLSNSQNKFRR